MTKIVEFPNKNNDHHMEMDIFGDKVILDSKGSETLMSGEKALSLLARAMFRINAMMEGVG